MCCQIHACPVRSLACVKIVLYIASHSLFQQASKRCCKLALLRPATSSSLLLHHCSMCASTAYPIITPLRWYVRVPSACENLHLPWCTGWARRGVQLLDWGKEGDDSRCAGGGRQHSSVNRRGCHALHQVHAPGHHHRLHGESPEHPMQHQPSFAC